MNEYIKTRNELRKVHGDRMVVLVMVGSFWEFYGEDPNDQSETSAPHIAKVLGIRLTRKDGKSQMPVSINNCYMLGFPSYTLDKYLKILVVDHNYTVGLIGQITSPTTTKIQRKLLRVVSPSTYEGPDEDSSVEGKAMCVYAKDGIFGITVLSLFNGAGVITETSDVDELIGNVKVHSPVEIVVIGSMDSTTLEDIKLSTYGRRTTVHDETDKDIRKTYENEDYQNGILKKVFPNTGLVDPIDAIDPYLHRMTHALTSYCRMLQFAYDHDVSLLTNIPIPKVCTGTSGHVKMNHTCLSDLNITGNSSEKTLLKIMNRCQTSMGKRMMYDRMTNPTTDAIELERRWGMIDDFLKPDVSNADIRKELAKIYDLARLGRKTGQKKMSRRDIVRLIESMESIDTLNKTFGLSINNYEDIMKILEPFDIEASMTGSPFKKGYCRDIDQTMIDIEQMSMDINKIVESFNSTPQGQIFKLERSDTLGTYLTSTQRRWTEFVKTAPSEQTFTVVTKAPNVRVNVKEIDDHHARMSRSEERLKDLIEARMNEFHETFSVMEPKLQSLANQIADLDIAVTNAYNATEYRLTRPGLVGSFGSVKVKGLRHLIVEQTNVGVRYVDNDVTLDPKQTHGILLFGLNAAGKSTLMKSVGAAIMMAQSGSYVPCDSMDLGPYRQIYTRIGLTDDIYRRYSTFVVEMMELKNIIKNADDGTLVLGDELCSSTEYISALSIVGAALKTLHTKGTSFIFASHLHSLNKLSMIKDLPRMVIKHLSVRFDVKLKCLVYERKLQDGPGSDSYGIEVLKSIISSTEFLKEAEKIRKEITNTSTSLLRPKKSRYNAKHIVERMCEVCKTTSDRTEVHHIRPQHLADTSGYIGQYHKNELHNLVTLCEACHDSLHNDQLKIDGYVETLEGKKLLIESTV